MTAHRISPQPSSMAAQLRELLGARDLFRMLLGREIRTRYRQTALGLAWVLLQPLVPALIFAAVFGAFARLPSGGTPYFLFALSGLVIFGLFSNAASRASTAFLRDGQLVSRVYFPRALLPLAAGSAAVVDFVVGLGLLVIFMFASGLVPTLAIILVLCVALAALALGLAFGLAVAALSGHYRDFAIAVPFVLQVALYASPIVYSTELVPPGLRQLYALNPLVGITETFRWALLDTPPPAVADVAIGVATGAGIVMLALAIYNRAARDLTDVI